MLQIKKFYLEESVTDKDGFIQIIIPQGAYEFESLNDEIMRITSDEGHFTEVDYPFTIKEHFSTLGSIIEISRQEPFNNFLFDDSIRDLLGFNATTIYEENNLSHNPVDILSFEKIFLETDIAQGIFLEGKWSGIIHNFTMDVDPGYKYIEKFRGGIQWYMMQSKGFVASSFKPKNENKELVSFNGQSITFGLSIKET